MYIFKDGSENVEGRGGGGKNPLSYIYINIE
jgi:hypothetical protein